jgi:predicted transcriptional regulator
MFSSIRINIRLDPATAAELKQIAQKTKTTVSQLCTKYVKQQLEDDEDAYWMKIIEERKEEPTILAEKVWNTLNL